MPAPEPASVSREVALRGIPSSAQLRRALEQKMLWLLGPAAVALGSVYFAVSIAVQLPRFPWASLTMMLSGLAGVAVAMRSGSYRRGIEVVNVGVFAAFTYAVLHQVGIYSSSLWWLCLPPVFLLLAGSLRLGIGLGLLLLLLMGVLAWAGPRSLGSVSLMFPNQHAQMLGAVLGSTVALLIVCGIFVYWRLQMERALESARDVAAQAAVVKAEFLATMSHEIRTPMNAVLGLNELALRTRLDERQRGYLQKAKLAGHALLQLIDQILDFSKIESGRLELESRPFELQHLLEHVDTIAGEPARAKGLQFLILVAPTVPARLVGDAHRLAQVLVNLCGNAVKFTERGRVLLLVGAPDGVAGRAAIRFEVQDSGIGIRAPERERLFQPFSQGDSSMTRRYGGTGLGLAISRQIVQLMGGEIGVASEPGVGSCFHVSVALVQADDGPPPVPVCSDASNPLRRAAVREADAGLRQRIAELLEALGHVVVADAAAPTDLFVGLGGGETVADHAPPRPTRVVLGPPAPDGPSAAGATVWVPNPVSVESLRKALAYQATPATPAPATTAPPDSGADLRGRRILLVEDNELNQLVARDLLEEVAGAHVDVAAEAATALAQLAHEEYDCVLMDVRLPGLNGYDLTRCIRADERTRALPIIAMTAHASTRDRQACFEAGMNDYITKPFQPEQLFALLSRWSRRLPALDAAPLAATAPDASAPAVAFDLGLSCCLGKRELYERVVRRFVETRPGVPQSIRSALGQQDAATAARLAHSLISSAGMVGANHLSQRARALVEAIEASEPVHLCEQLDRLDRDWAAVTDELGRYLERSAASAGSPA